MLPRARCFWVRSLCVFVSACTPFGHRGKGSPYDGWMLHKHFLCVSQEHTLGRDSMSTSQGPCKEKELSALFLEPLGTWRIKTPKLYSLKHQGSVTLMWQCAVVSESLDTDKMSLHSWSVVRGNPPASLESRTREAAGGLSLKLTKRLKQ
jgi:hypothetical protein